MADEITTGGLLRAEYEQLKQEQRGRIGVRDNLIYATLGSMAAVIAAALQAKGPANLLLLLPPVTIVLGWTYLVNDEKVSAIGRYIRADLAPRLAALTADGAPVFGWESIHRTGPRRTSRKTLQLAVDLGTFCVPALAAIVVFWVNGPLTPAFLSVSIVEAAAVGLLTWQIFVHADLSTGPA
jgi:hypothetical protein